MQHILLIYTNQDRWAELSTEEIDQVHSDCGAWHEELVKKGQAVAAAALKPPALTSSVREKEGKVLITDGPFAETREVLGGFQIIECRDMAEAREIANRFPALRLGSVVEIRALETEGCCKSEIKPQFATAS